MWGLYCFGLLLISNALAQKTNLTLKEIYPCSGVITATVSRFKTDVYAVIPSFEHCDVSHPQSNIKGLRVFSFLKSHTNDTVVFLSRQGSYDASTWPIPFQPQGFEDYSFSVSRTMCPIDTTELDENKEQNNFLLYLDVFTSSLNEVEYQIQVDEVKQFIIELDGKINVRVGASSPQVFYFKFPDNVSTVSVEAEADNKTCAFFSIQENDCPINDLLRTASSRGKFQTMSKFGYITVMAHEMQNREFVIILITTNYETCHTNGLQPQRNYSDVNDDFSQTITVTVRNTETSAHAFGMAIGIPIMLLFLLGICFLILISALGTEHTRGCLDHCKCIRKCHEKCKKSTNSNGSVQYGQEDTEKLTSENKTITWLKTCYCRSKIVENEIDHEKITKDKNKYYITELNKKKSEDLKKRYNYYVWFVVIIGIFYSIPAVQLLFSQLKTLDDEGNQDKCYFNFKCAYRSKNIIAFHSLFSNIGYIMLGLFFLIIVAIRQWYSSKYKENCDQGESGQVKIGRTAESPCEVKNKGNSDINETLPLIPKEKSDGKGDGDSSQKKAGETAKSPCEVKNEGNSDINETVPLITKEKSDGKGDGDSSQMKAGETVKLQSPCEVKNKGNSDINETLPLLQKDKGVPKFYGLYYALGVALMMEGVMSLMYHFCPTNSNFQFDTSFMFIIGGLILAQTFQKRHPDFHANACIAFFCFAVVVIIVLITINTDQYFMPGTRIILGIVLNLIVIIFAFLFYNFYFCAEQNPFQESFKKCWSKIAEKENSDGQVKLVEIAKETSDNEDSGQTKTKETAKETSDSKRDSSQNKTGKTTMDKCKEVPMCILKEIICSRTCEIILLVIVNIPVTVVCLMKLDIATSILVIFIINAVGFFGFYCTNKICNKECRRIGWLILFIFVAISAWSFGLYFFQVDKETNSNLSPAESRDMNKKCWCGIYDRHDIWHFLSAVALFLTFCILLVLDDDVDDKPTDELKAF